MLIKLYRIVSKIFLILAFSLCLNVKPSYANSNFASLTYCKDSQAFEKRLSTALKKLESRLALYEKDSLGYSSIIKKMNSTTARFEKYKKDNLLCGKDGLPRIIATGQWNHSKEFILPALAFIYIAGWIGWVGRKYLQWSASSENPFDNEILINIPIAIKMANSGFLWPLDAWKELTCGKLLALKDEVTISPR